jgi:serine/threonine protein kinase
MLADASGSAERAHADGVDVDWWSLGVLVCQCLTLATPFEGPTPQATLANVANGRRTMAQPLTGWGLSGTASSFVEALLEPDPASRLGSSSLRGTDEVRVHPFFWGLDWARLEKRQLPTPHAAQCHARAVAVTSHPDLHIPTPARLPRQYARKRVGGR